MGIQKIFRPKDTDSWTLPSNRRPSGETTGLRCQPNRIKTAISRPSHIAITMIMCRLEDVVGHRPPV